MLLSWKIILKYQPHTKSDMQVRIILLVGFGRAAHTRLLEITNAHYGALRAPPPAHLDIKSNQIKSNIYFPFHLITTNGRKFT